MSRGLFDFAKIWYASARWVSGSCFVIKAVNDLREGRLQVTVQL